MCFKVYLTLSAFSKLCLNINFQQVIYLSVWYLWQIIVHVQNFKLIISLPHNRSVPLCNFIQLFCGWCMYWSWYPSTCCWWGIWCSEGILDPRWIWRLSYWANWCKNLHFTIIFLFLHRYFFEWDRNVFIPPRYKSWEFTCNI